MRTYASRPIQFCGIRNNRGYQLKLYSVVYGFQPIDLSRFEAGFDLITDCLPDGAIGPGRPGVGLLIAHQGCGYDYAVLGWWDRENELPVCIAVCEQTLDAKWRQAKGPESICVWDIHLIAYESDAYITSVLAGGDMSMATEKYISTVYGGYLYQI